MGYESCLVINDEELITLINLIWRIAHFNSAGKETALNLIDIMRVKLLKDRHMQLIEILESAVSRL